MTKIHPKQLKTSQNKPKEPNTTPQKTKNETQIGTKQHKTSQYELKKNPQNKPK